MKNKIFLFKYIMDYKIEFNSLLSNYYCRFIKDNGTIIKINDNFLMRFDNKQIKRK